MLGNMPIESKNKLTSRGIIKSRVISISELKLIVETLRNIGFRVQLVDGDYRIVFFSESYDELLVQEDLQCHLFLLGKEERCIFCLRDPTLDNENSKYDLLESDASIVKIHVIKYLVEARDGSIIPIYLHSLLPATEEAFERFQNRLFYFFFGHKQANVLQHLFFWKDFIQMDQVRDLIPQDQVAYLEKTLRTLDVLSSLIRHRPHYRSAIQESEPNCDGMRLQDLIQQVREDLELVLVFPNQNLVIKSEKSLMDCRVAKLLRGLLFSIIHDWQNAFKPHVPNTFKITFSRAVNQRTYTTVTLHVFHPKIRREDAKTLILHLHPIQDFNQMKFLGTQLSKFLLVEMGGSLEMQFEEAPRNETIMELTLPLRHKDSPLFLSYDHD